MNIEMIINVKLLVKSWLSFHGNEEAEAAKQTILISSISYACKDTNVFECKILESYFRKLFI